MSRDNPLSLNREAKPIWSQSFFSKQFSLANWIARILCTIVRLNMLSRSSNVYENNTSCIGKSITFVKKGINVFRIAYISIATLLRQALNIFSYSLLACFNKVVKELSSSIGFCCCLFLTNIPSVVTETSLIKNFFKNVMCVSVKVVPCFIIGSPDLPITSSTRTIPGFKRSTSTFIQCLTPFQSYNKRTKALLRFVFVRLFFRFFIFFCYFCNRCYFLITLDTN